MGIGLWELRTWGILDSTASNLKIKFDLEFPTNMTKVVHTFWPFDLPNETDKSVYTGHWPFTCPLILLSAMEVCSTVFWLNSGYRKVSDSKSGILVSYTRDRERFIKPLRQIRRRSDYIIGFIAPAIGPNKSKKLTPLIAPTHNIRGKVWMKNNIHGFTDDYCLSVKPCMLSLSQTLPCILCASAVSRVSFLICLDRLPGQ